MPVNRSSFVEIEKSFDLPAATLLALFDDEGSYSKHLQWKSDATTVTKIGFVLKAPQKVQIGSYLLSMSYDISTATTKGLLIGDHLISSPSLSSERTDSLTHLSKQLQSDASLWSHPCALGIIMLQVHNVRCQSYLNHTNAQVKQIENVNGVVLAGGLANRGRVDPRDLTRSELLSQMIRSHTALTELMWVNRCTLWMSDAIEFMLQELPATSKHLSTQKARGFLPMSRKLNEGLLFIKSTSKASTRWSDTQIERIKSQVSVLYAFIAQQDNQLNAMIAVSSRRDSAAMKILAVITTVFLPGTYVSTLFSMGMFDWPRASANSWVSPTFWIYWTVTIPLTVFVIVAWRVWWKHQDAAYKIELASAADPTQNGKADR